MSAIIRKIVTVVEETHLEMGQKVAPPTRRAAAIAVIENPFAGRYVEDLSPLIEIGEELGDLLSKRAVAALGIGLFGLFFILYNIAIGYTTAARASLALSTLPLQTMLVAALRGAEPLTMRKSAGVAVAMLGVLAALGSGLAAAPIGAWRGELVMTAAVFCMAFYNVLSRPLMARSSPLGFLAVGMGFGAVALVLAGIAADRLSVLSNFDAPQWIAAAYLGVAGGALAFVLWVLALQRATPTRVARCCAVTTIPLGAATGAAEAA